MMGSKSSKNNRIYHLWLAVLVLFGCSFYSPPSVAQGPGKNIVPPLEPQRRTRLQCSASKDGYRFTGYVSIDSGERFDSRGDAEVLIRNVQYLVRTNHPRAEKTHTFFIDIHNRSKTNSKGEQPAFVNEIHRDNQVPNNGSSYRVVKPNFRTINHRGVYMHWYIVPRIYFGFRVQGGSQEIDAHCFKYGSKALHPIKTPYGIVP